MSDQSRRRSTSSSVADSSQGPSKVRKVQSSSSGRIRRAARGEYRLIPPSISRSRLCFSLTCAACDPCRKSKLKCLSAESAAEDKRCAHCAKMDLVCEYTNPAPSHAVLDDGSDFTSEGKDGNQRLSQLEANVAKMLQMLQSGAVFGGSSGQGQPTSAMESTMESAMFPPQPPRSYYPSDPSPMQQPTVNHAQTSSLAAMATLALAGEPSHMGNSSEFDQWFPQSDMSGGSPLGLSRDTGSSFGATTNALTTRVAYDPGSGTLGHSSNSPIHRRVEFAPTGFSVSPNAPSDTAKSHKSGVSQSDPHSLPNDEQYNQAQARPLPKVPAASRMAAFRDSSSHEAPFRSLTYNPDSYRNVEISEESSGDGRPGGASGGMQSMNGVGGGEGGKTPKRGRGDPIDRGVFLEKEARALFSL